MKLAKYIIAIFLLVAVVYNSIYFRKLTEVKAALVAKEFNAVQYASNFWVNKLMPNLHKAVELDHLIQMLSANAGKTFEDYSHALGIGNLRYFLVKGKAEVIAVNENSVTVLIKSDSAKQSITIATEYIFGNEVRDATGLIDINEFSNTMDFNSISAELNKIIRQKVLPPFVSRVKKGDIIEFVGAIELNKEHVNIQKIEVVPIELQFPANSK